MSEPELFIRQTEMRDGLEIGATDEGILITLSELELQTYAGNPEILFREYVEKARRIRRVRRFKRLLESST